MMIEEIYKKFHKQFTDGNDDEDFGKSENVVDLINGAKSTKNNKKNCC